MKLTTTDPDLWADLYKVFKEHSPVDFMGRKYIGVRGCFDAAVGPVGPHCDVCLEPMAELVWNGEGSPPVGTVCEVRVKGFSGWIPANVLFCQDNALVISWAAEGVAHPTTLDAVDLRPIRTPEQIEEREREAEASRMLDAANLPDSYKMSRKHAFRLYDAGYRKVQP